MNLSRLLLVSASLACASLLFAQSDKPFSSLEERMTGREFTGAGLHKLSPEELAALNEWIRKRSVADYEAPQQTPPEAPQQTQSRSAQKTDAGTTTGTPSIEKMERETIRSPIVGEFSGWSGNTEFELENGMVWKQKEPGRFRVQPVADKIVTITPGLLGSWFLRVEGTNRSIKVERIK